MHNHQSQRDWAKQYGVSAMTISRWQRGFRQRLGIDAPLGEPLELLRLWPQVFEQRANWRITAAIGRIGRPSAVNEAMKAAGSLTLDWILHGRRG